MKSINSIIENTAVFLLEIITCPLTPTASAARAMASPTALSTLSCSLCVKISPDEKVYNESFIKAMFMKLQANNGPTMEIKSAIRDSIKRFPDTDYFYLILGWVLKKEGSIKAIDAFRVALRINPKNEDARRELRLYEMRGKI